MSRISRRLSKPHHKHNWESVLCKLCRYALLCNAFYCVSLNSARIRGKRRPFPSSLSYFCHAAVSLKFAAESRWTQGQYDGKSGCPGCWNFPEPSCSVAPQGSVSWPIRVLRSISKVQRDKIKCVTGELLAFPYHLTPSSLLSSLSLE